MLLSPRQPTQCHWATHPSTSAKPIKLKKCTVVIAAFAAVTVHAAAARFVAGITTDTATTTVATDTDTMTVTTGAITTAAMAVAD